MVLPANIKNKTKTNEVDRKKKKNKQGLFLVYNSQRSFRKFNDIHEFKELLLDSMHKRLSEFKKRLICLRLLTHKQIKIKT